MYCRTDDQYFRIESPTTIAEHVTSLYGAKILAWSRHQKQLEINLEKEHAEGKDAVYIHSSAPGVSDPKNDRERRCAPIPPLTKSRDSSQGVLSMRTGLTSTRELSSISDRDQNLRTLAVRDLDIQIDIQITQHRLLMDHASF